jgi:hypothetical protein
MAAVDDPFEVVVVHEDGELFAELSRKPIAPDSGVVTPVAAEPATATARLHGFDLEERPLVADVPGLPNEMLAARTTVGLRRSQIGSTVVLLFEGGNRRQPIIVGVIRSPAAADDAGAKNDQVVSVQRDDEKLVLTAEREIVLRCGAASITLTRAGKVLIDGAYVVSRSSGYNKIKGAAVDIN